MGNGYALGVDNPHSALSFPDLAGPAVATHPLRLIS
jgi:hypothetical protein